MSSMTCSGCGAALALPKDLTAQEVVCPFCPSHTPLAADLLAVRLREHQELFAEQQQQQAMAQVGATVRKTTKFVMWVVIASTVFPIVLMVAIMAIISFASSRATSHDFGPHGPPRSSHPH